MQSGSTGAPNSASWAAIALRRAGSPSVLLLSGGIDSPVAGYMIAKRGVTIDATYFHAPPYTSERV